MQPDCARKFAAVIAATVENENQWELGGTRIRGRKNQRAALDIINRHFDYLAPRVCRVGENRK
jgi:hypothetical protein